MLRLARNSVICSTLQIFLIRIGSHRAHIRVQCQSDNFDTSRGEPYSSVATVAAQRIFDHKIGLHGMYATLDYNSLDERHHAYIFKILLYRISLSPASSVKACIARSEPPGPRQGFTTQVVPRPTMSNALCLNPAGPSHFAGSRPTLAPSPARFSNC
jgi:hypothetical protein